MASKGSRSVPHSVITREAASCSRWEPIQRQHLDEAEWERDLGIPSLQPIVPLSAQETLQKRKQEETSPLIKETFLRNRQRQLQKNATNQHVGLWTSVPTMKHFSPSVPKAQGWRQKSRQRDCKMEKIREFSSGSSPRNIRSYTHWHSQSGWPH